TSFGAVQPLSFPVSFTPMSFGILSSQAKNRGVAVVLVTHNVTHAMTVGDHFAILIHGEKADDFAKGERTREEITDLMAGGEAMAELEAELAQLSGTGKRTSD
ncbi:MAG: hypothetical protein KDE19_11660, partial [Caldilineaceae bacterium]|nr:hypothetical protein [Caldilineaceae bacterium]